MLIMAANCILVKSPISLLSVLQDYSLYTVLLLRGTVKCNSVLVGESKRTAFVQDLSTDWSEISNVSCKNKTSRDWIHQAQERTGGD